MVTLNLTEIGALTSCAWTLGSLVTLAAVIAVLAAIRGGQSEGK